MRMFAFHLPEDGAPALLKGGRTMRRILSLSGLARAAWALCLGFLGLLAGTVLERAWHPHFLPATAILMRSVRARCSIPSFVGLVAVLALVPPAARSETPVVHDAALEDLEEPPKTDVAKPLLPPRALLRIGTNDLRTPDSIMGSEDRHCVDPGAKTMGVKTGGEKDRRKHAVQT
jgi:hypothetical protein